MIQLTKVEIIEETAKFYGEDPIGRRAMSKDGEACVYLNKKTGCKCGIGRCMLKSILNRLTNSDMSTGIKSLLLKKDTLIDKILFVRYRGHDLYFWVEIQNLHDTEYYWKGEEGLTGQGEQYKANLLEKYKEE